MQQLASRVKRSESLPLQVTVAKSTTQPHKQEPNNFCIDQQQSAGSGVAAEWADRSVASRFARPSWLRLNDRPAMVETPQPRHWVPFFFRRRLLL